MQNKGLHSNVAQHEGVTTISVTDGCPFVGGEAKVLLFKSTEFYTKEHNPLIILHIL